jgi:prepilin-type processing-associated H-X9-DG protein
MTEQMEPERKIEKLLRAYAKKRRAQAGDPLQLHPATRRMLQGEIARNAPKPDEEDASMSLWELFRQQWAFLVSFALIIFFVATMFLPALSSAKKKAQTISAMSNLKQIGLAVQMAAEENNGNLPASLDALTNRFVSDKILTDTVSGKRFIYVAAGEKLDSLPSNFLLAYSPTDKKGRAVLFADGHVEVINGARFSELTNRALPQLVAANDSARRQLGEISAAITLPSGNAVAAPPISGQLKSEDNRNESKLADLGIATPSAGKPAANALAAPATTVYQLATAQTNSVQFASATSHSFALNLQNSFKNTVVPAKAAVVLANFQVQQNGNAIRVVDADGSAYDGSLLPKSAVAQNGPAPVATSTPPITAPAQFERVKIIANRDELQTAQNYFFRVTGTNRTLKQNVVFTGNLLPISNATTNLQQSFGGSDGLGGGGTGGGQLQSALTNQNQLPWSNSRIAGTAVIAETNNIEINALPLSP